MATIEELNGSQTLIYSYLNEPRAEIQDRSPMHYGTAILNVSNSKHLTGNYFTNRRTRGSMDLKAVVRKGKDENITNEINNTYLNNNKGKKEMTGIGKKNNKRRR